MKQEDRKDVVLWGIIEQMNLLYELPATGILLIEEK